MYLQTFRILTNEVMTTNSKENNYLSVFFLREYHIPTIHYFIPRFKLYSIFCCHKIFMIFFIFSLKIYLLQ